MPSVERRGNSIRVKWWGGEYVLDADGNPTKRKKYESASGPEPGVPFGDDDEAYAYGLDRESDVRNNRHRPRNTSRTMMSEYCDLWSASLDLRVRSTKTYRSRLNAVIKPYWRHHSVDQVTPIDYAAFDKFVTGKYSTNYRKGVLAIFKMMMDDAVVKYRLREDTPIVEQRRRGKYKKAQVRRKKRNLPVEAIHQLATNAHTIWGYSGWAYIWTLAFTCMRPPGESYGLQRGYCSAHWPESEPDEELREESMARYKDLSALRIQYQTYVADGRHVLAAPKYDSWRTAVIPPFLGEMHTAVLASHRSPWLFVSMTGKPMLSTNFKADYWYPMRDGADERPARVRYERWQRPEIPAVPEMAGEDIYRLRHWAKAKLDEPGDIPKVAIEARMGHELPGIEGTYSEVTLAMEERIVEYLQSVWEKEVVGAGLWIPPFPILPPDDLLNEAPPLFSGLPVLEN